MCSRYSLTSPPEAVRCALGYRPVPAAGDGLGIESFPPRYNIAPTQPVLIVRTGAAGDREPALVRWGLIPGWVKDPDAFATLINARAESALDKPSFRNAMQHRRCLVPADAFYEWTGKAGTRIPHLVRPAPGSRLSAPMALAGLWEHWQGAEGSEIETMAILTVPANRTLRALHDRMPAIIAPAAYGPWLDVRDVRGDGAAELLQPAPDDVLELFEVGTRLNDPAYDAADVQTPARATLL